MHCKSLWIKASAKCINVNDQKLQIEMAGKLGLKYGKKSSVALLWVWMCFTHLDSIIFESF